ncbi:MAG: hypothetical protein HS129_15300 [Leptospiraceae bacterium]|nr:hypothetical protein [Leptospiraceae bacterium]NUM41787.1 hypothetical protein [Leptospiraceae bacterium]
MNLERNTRENPFKILSSILALSVIVFIFFTLKGDPSNPETFQHLSNLKSVTEEGSLFSATEPIPIYTLSIVKKIFRANYIPIFRTISVFFFAIFLHLSMKLFVKDKWNLNHYIILYLVAFLPYINSIPEKYFGELVSAIVLISIFLTFKMESILDIILFVLLTLLAFFSNFMTFLFGYSGFVIKASILGARRTKVTVFYKRKNIPKLILLVYLSLFFLILLTLGVFDFFGKHSFHFIFHSFLDHLLSFGISLGIVYVGQFLLKSEKELNSPVSTGILIILIAVSGIYNFKKEGFNLSELNLQKNEIHSLKMRGVISKADQVYSDKFLADFAYFYSKEKLKYHNLEEMKANDFLVVNGIWTSDRNQIGKLFHSNKPLFYPLSSTSVLMRKELIEKILQSKEELPFKGKLQKVLNEFEKRTPFDNFKFSLYSIFNTK